MQPPRAATVAKWVAAALAARLAYRAGRFFYNVLTSVPPNASIYHTCIPPADWKHGLLTEPSTRAFVAQHFPELQDIADRGNLVVMQPAAMLAELMAAQQQERNASQQAAGGGSDNSSSQPGAFLAANCAAVSEGSGPALSQEDVDELLRNPGLQQCLANALPEVLVFVGTVHVAKESGDDVARVIKAVRPARVALELCPSRLQAMLLDPFADPLSDLQPCPERAARQATLKKRSLSEIFEATLKSRDHNILMSLLTGMYARLEDQLQVSAGLEFLAARRAMIELLQAEAAADDAAADDQQQQQQRQGQARSKVPNWLQCCIAADRPVGDTLTGLWGELGPWQRLELMYGVVSMLLWKMDEELISSLANEDLVDGLLEELREDFPQLCKPLLHDRNWVLAVNTWCAAQHSGGGPVVSVVGKGHLPGIVYVVQELVRWCSKTGGVPIRVLASRPEEQDADEDAAALASEE